MTAERAFTKLADRLGLPAVGYRAEGPVDGVTVTLSEVRVAGRPLLSIRAPLLRPLDLRLSIGLGLAAPRAVTAEHKETNDPELEGFAIWGAGEVERARALLGEELRSALRNVARAGGAKLVDSLAEVLVEDADTDRQERLMRLVIALRATIERAARGVPVVKELAPALPSFERFATELGVEATTCPLGLLGEVDGCAVDVFRFLPGSKDDAPTFLIHVAFPTPLEGDVLLNSHLGEELWPRIRSTADVLWTLGPRPGWLAFGRRFKAARGTLGDVDRTFGGLRALARVADSGDGAFVNITSERIISGVKLRDLAHPPDIAGRVRALVAAGKDVHSGAKAAPSAPRRGPYR